MTSSPPVRMTERIRDYIQSGVYGHNDRLPPERRLAEHFGVSRNELRRGLAQLEAEGVIWRHVGRGTSSARGRFSIWQTSPTSGNWSRPPDQVVRVRLMIEPETARLAARDASGSDIVRIRNCAQRCRDAADWRGYEAWDNNLHHAIATATHNKLIIYLFETLNVVRRSMVWGQRRGTRKPPQGLRELRGTRRHRRGDHVPRRRGCRRGHAAASQFRLFADTPDARRLKRDGAS